MKMDATIVKTLLFSQMELANALLGIFRTREIAQNVMLLVANDAMMLQLVISAWSPLYSTAKKIFVPAH